MSGLTDLPGQVPTFHDSPEPPPDPAVQVRAILGDLSAVVTWFLVAAVIGALVWWQITPLPAYTRTGEAGILDEQQLARQVNSDGWFFVVAAVGGLISGIGLLSWRKRDPLLMVVLVAVGGIFATWLMIETGLLLGPGDPGERLRTAKEGAKVALQLKVHAHALWVVWPSTALVGAIGVIWGTEDRPPAEKNGQAFTG